MSLSPTAAHEQLDANGWLDDAHGPGIYALDVWVPDSVDRVQEAWLSQHGLPLPDGYAAQLAAAARARYVGRSRDVYGRVMDHAEGEVRRASFVSAFVLRGVCGVWSGENTGVAERDRARALSDAETVAWCDGELF